MIGALLAVVALVVVVLDVVGILGSRADRVVPAPLFLIVSTTIVRCTLVTSLRSWSAPLSGCK